MSIPVKQIIKSYEGFTIDNSNAIVLNKFPRDICIPQICIIYVSFNATAL